MDYFGIKVVSVRWKLLSLCCFDGYYVKDCLIQHFLSTFKLRMSDFKELSDKMTVQKKTNNTHGIHEHVKYCSMSK